MDELIKSLQSISLFQHFGEEQLQQLVTLGGSSSVAGGETLFEQGDLADSMYVILEGAVKVYGKNQIAGGDEIELSTLEKGAFFGEVALVDGGTRSATIRTSDDCEFFILNRSGFIRILTQSPELLSEVLADISGKIRSSNEKIFKQILERQKVQSEMEIERHRSLAQMVAGVAHEINTPLGIVNVTASMITENLTSDIMDKITDDEVRETLDDIKEAAQLMLNNIARANKLIQTFKSISVSQITDTLEEVELPQLLSEIIDLFKIKARQAGIQVKITLDPELETGRWFGYPGYLSQIMLNLLSNIERYAYPDNIGGTVDVRLKDDPERSGCFLLQVEDYGQGMPPEHAAKVFDVFFTTGRSKGGTGLGMSIVHNLVTSAMKGHISLNSEPDQGTCFSISLPHRISTEIDA